MLIESTRLTDSASTFEESDDEDGFQETSSVADSPETYPQDNYGTLVFNHDTGPQQREYT